MTANRRKKSTRQRAGTTHGWGSMKKHRGKGNKGGAGMAGTGKRGDTKKPSIWKNKKYFGKHGFKKKGMLIDVKPININILQTLLSNLLVQQKITKENDSFIIDLNKIGFNKLLGTGKVIEKMKINVTYASKKAVTKVKEFGGDVITAIQAKEE